MIFRCSYRKLDAFGIIQYNIYWREKPEIIRSIASEKFLFNFHFKWTFILAFFFFLKNDFFKSPETINSVTQKSLTPTLKKVFLNEGFNQISLCLRQLQNRKLIKLKKIDEKSYSHFAARHWGCHSNTQEFNESVNHSPQKINDTYHFHTVWKLPKKVSSMRVYGIFRCSRMVNKPNLFSASAAPR